MRKGFDLSKLGPVSMADTLVLAFAGLHQPL